jgi:thiamine-phosphate pyrophosphorylase
VQQSLRSLEEIAKLTDAAVAARFERLRYESYTLEKAIDVTRTSIELLRLARLYVLVDGRSSEEEFRTLVSTLVAAGVDILQLRDKQLGDRELVARARMARELTRDTATLLIINDRPDIAALSRAEGVHVGQDEISVKDARAIVGPRALIGVSTHSIEQARQAVLDGANYIGVGPTFPSETKQFAEYPGLELLRQVAGEISLPAFAIGGIKDGNISTVLKTGLKRVAVSAAVTRATNPREVAKRIRAMLS